MAALESGGVDAQRPPARVQLGLELCARRLPSPAALAAEVALLQGAGFAVSLVLPVAYEAAWDELLAAVDAAVAAGDGRLELVVADLGLLTWARGAWPVALATGRLFNRMKRDQFAADPTVIAR